MTSPHWVKLIERQAERLQFEERLHYVLRNLKAKRRLLGIACCIIFIVYWFASSGGGSSASSAQQCINDRVRSWKRDIEDGNAALGEDAVRFIGNGHFGVDMFGEIWLSSNGSRILSVQSGFYAQVDVSFEDSTVSPAEETISHFDNGIWRRIKCAIVDDDCTCVTTTSYAHRTRPDVFIEEMLVMNPTRNAITVNIDRKRPRDRWTSNKSGSEAEVFTRDFYTTSTGIICSTAPGRFTVLHKREEILRFTCIVQQKLLKSPTLNKSIIDQYSLIHGTSSNTLDNEHKEAWRKLNKPHFYLSPSKAPNVLHPSRINATRYVVLSNVKAPTFETDKKYEIPTSESCYKDHSTILFPSRLWQNWETPQKMLRLAEIWLLTLEKKGCAKRLEQGAEGVSEALVLSLSGASMQDDHLEIAFDPSELHRPLAFGPIYVTKGAYANVKILIDEENRPYFEVNGSENLFVCDAGCLDPPIGVKHQPQNVAMKVTKPLTSLLYISPNKKHLEQLRLEIQHCRLLFLGTILKNYFSGKNFIFSIEKFDMCPCSNKYQKLINIQELLKHKEILSNFKTTAIAWIRCKIYQFFET
ncbi:hypothetical protein WR25_18501 [Diploscapter pachys]|uniref:Uncharacterized protein n=1 Tax=Diploscapter pachys TaxID=2018661 RepID=A0A2A2JEE5_9BILA|nr:hypothetical protein WR25_18501 [Diploscapter pachys]